MAKTIKSKVEYQVTELVNNLNEAATTTSEQKRDFFTTKALYNAKRLSTFVSKAKIGAMVLLLSLGMVACGNGASQETVIADSMKVDTAVVVEATPVATDTAVSGGSGTATAVEHVK